MRNRGPAPAITTEDGITVHPGDIVYNYYDCWWGTIVSDPDPEGWFDVRRNNEDFERTVALNGSRICTYEPEWAMTDGKPSCKVCGATTHFSAHIAAPGFGQAWECEAGHVWTRIGNGQLLDPKQTENILQPGDVI